LAAGLALTKKIWYSLKGYKSVVLSNFSGIISLQNRRKAVLKRYQVLLPEWLEDNIRFFADRYDLSFSEVIRAEICVAILAAVPKLYSDYKPGLTHDEIMKMLKDENAVKMEREEVHRILSKIYFEARKAVEFRVSAEKEKRKK
jgi:hypothetical protein